MTDDARREHGDWQTPGDFATRCCRIIKYRFGFTPDHVIEPTCGVGNFIEASRKTFPAADVLGIELNPEYIDGLAERFKNDDGVTVIQADFLKDEISAEIIGSKSTLILGNPPWVTNSTLSALGSDNLPEKTNFKGLRGIDAMTGESNFDICEWIILRALSMFEGNDDMLAMLCKTSVARNVAIEIAKAGKNAHITILDFNSFKVFGINAAACLLICDFRSDALKIERANIDTYDDTTELVFDGKALIEKLDEELEQLVGVFQLQWRQGVKHDCSKAMELKKTDSGYVNKLGETVDIEDEYVYPFIKSSKSRIYVINDGQHAVPMTQKKIGEDTSHLEHDAPRFWQYLTDHADLFDARKSSIYKNSPRFAMFGVGDYSYAPYKVAVSGFYKEPVFSLAYGAKPIMFDDTCYFLPFDKETDAQVCMLLLNSERVIRFYKSVAFLDSKRPYSKKVLAKLDIEQAVRTVSSAELNETADRIGVPFRVDDVMLQDFLFAITGAPALF